MTRLILGLIALAISFCASPANAAARFWNPYIVTGAVSGTGSVCRLTISPAITGSGLVAGDTVNVTGITGATGCNVAAAISTVVDSTHIELTGTTFGGAYISGGCAAGGEITATNTSNWAASSTSTCGSGGSSVPGSADAVTFDANSLLSTIKLNFGGTWSIQSLATTAFPRGAGCVWDNSANNNNVTIGGGGNGWVNSGAGVCTFNLGSATYTLTDTNGNIWNWSGFNGTLTAGTSTILFSATATGLRNFIPGTTQTYNNFTVTNGAANTGEISIFAAVTLNNVTMTNVRQMVFPNNQTTTINGTFSYSAGGGQYGILTSSGGASASLPATVVLANATTLQSLLIQNITRTGTGTLACNPCVDGGGNTTNANFTITAPSGGSAQIIGGL